MPLILVLIAIGFVVAWVVWRSNNAMWTIRVKDGRVVRVDGPAPVGFVTAVREIVAHPPVAQATIAARKAENGAVLSISGLNEGTRQRLNNVFRLQPQSVLRSGPNPVNERNVRKAVGLAWLINLFRR